MKCEVVCSAEVRLESAPSTRHPGLVSCLASKAEQGSYLRGEEQGTKKKRVTWATPIAAPVDTVPLQTKT